MSFIPSLLNKQRLLQPENAQLLAATLGVAGSLYVAWGLGKRAVQTMKPSFMPGEANPLLLATIYENITSRHADDDDLEGAEEYDVVIVGGGTAGCVLAARLSEDPNLKVLLIEAGKSDLAHMPTRMPAMMPRLFGSEIDWQLTTAPEPDMHNRTMCWPRGKVLGGCSSINAMMYVRGPTADYDEWASKYGATGWAWSDLQPYFTKCETFTPSKAWAVDTAPHGSSGPWQISYPRFVSKLVPAFMKGCNAIGIPTVQDVNDGKPGMLGVTRIQTFIDQEGRRSSTATAYLTDKVCARKNLKISVGMTVTRVIHQTGPDGEPVAAGVELASSEHAPVRYRVRAKRDVILAAGAVHTPHLLKISGVGPKEELAQHGIKLVKDLPGVGANLQDHLLIGMTVNVKAGLGLNYLKAPTGGLSLFLRWLLMGSGPLASNMCESVAWVRSHDDPAMVDKIADLSSSPREPDMELFSIPLFYQNMSKTLPPDLAASQWTLAQIPLRPDSVGSITLADRSPFTPPVIRANYFSTEHDRQISIWAFKKNCEVAKASGVFESWEHPQRADALTDAEILDYLKEAANTCYHPSGTTAIGLEKDNGVLGTADLKVHGVRGLRVCDAGVMPRITAGHTCAPVIAIAEKFADMLKAEYGSAKA
ncbi:GMC oxidoreductase [Athelia psychrophila]|uniref:GMC oxidoreductase n=1 Tax=Athelia psychrophila TaxID=1759441 RepID=A0A166STA5_9AGAM|nr:GMC oxidoreductase [Fibularhizoctonia sp. CBS 109695]